jgi:phytoene desaturase
MQKNIIVIGAGFSGITAAAHLAKFGHSVTVFEKNSSPGGRARMYEAEGFRFDMGPSWYWMPEIFERFFESFGKKPSDFYQLQRLDPSYQVFFGKGETLNPPAGMEALERFFEQQEPGSSAQLRKFLQDAQFKYDAVMHEFVQLPALSALEFVKWKIVKNAFRLDIHRSHASHVRRYFKNEKLVKILEFPVLFLGATPENTPALYSLMNYADMALGTWYPMGGMYKIIEGMVQVAEQEGANFKYNEPVSRIVVKNGKATGIETPNGFFPADAVLASADYQHVDQTLTESAYRSYDASYWESRVMAPSSLLFYLGIDKKLQGLQHHNLFFDTDFKQHSQEIYESKKWPKDPLFYVCAPSISDPSVAPEGCENLFVLVPLAPGLEDKPEHREKCYQQVMERLENLTGQEIRKHVRYMRDYAHRDFEQDYHAFKGNAYGLANTLMQTAFLKPKMRSKKLPNLFFAGQLSTPGPGMPPSIISGEVAANLINKL